MLDKALPFVSIVIPVFNEERYLAPCLTSLTSLTYPKDRHEILLVDNGSIDRTIEIARGYRDVNIYVKENVKVGAVRNYGVEKAKGSLIVFLDSDCVVRPDWLTDGVCKLETNPNTVIGGRYILRENPSWLEKYWVLGSPETRITNALVGGCIFISKSTFCQLGGFNEKLNAGEDVDLTERLMKEQFIVKIDSSLNVIHLGYPSKLMPFVKRQLWHSSDYINGLPNSLRDKIFLLTLAFLAGMIGAISSLIFSSINASVLITSTFLVFFSPAILSVKRIARSGEKYERFFDYISIYIVDFLYLIGRALGVISGIRNLLTFRSYAKVGRR